MGEEAAVLEREAVLNCLLRRPSDRRLGTPGERSARVAERPRVVADVVSDREVAIEQLAKPVIELVLVVRAGVGRIAGQSQDQDGQEVPQGFGLSWHGPAGGLCRRVLRAQLTSAAIDRGPGWLRVLDGDRTKSVVRDRCGLSVWQQEIRLEEHEIAGAVSLVVGEALDLTRT